MNHNDPVQDWRLAFRQTWWEWLKEKFAYALITTVVMGGLFTVKVALILTLKEIFR